MDVNPVYWEREFYSYLFQLLCEKGGTRLQMASSDIVTEMMKLPVKHAVNLHRKQYGNITQLLKTAKNPSFIVDANNVKLKEKPDIDSLYKIKAISDENYKLYVRTYDEVQKKLIEVMLINKSNVCKVCKRTPGMCGDDEDAKLSHIPLYQLLD